LLIGAEFALCDKRSRTTKTSLMPAVAGFNLGAFPSIEYVAH